MTAEIDRVANQTSFNGTKLIDGSFANQLFQVGANSGQTIGINNIVDANAAALGSSQFAADASGTVASGTDISGLTINGVTIDDVDSTGDAAQNAEALSIAINEKFDQTGVYASIDGADITLSSVTDGEDLVVSGTVSGTGLSAATEAASGSAETFVSDLDISTFVGSQRALEIADNSLTEVTTARADLGAIQNRFSSTIANLETTSENLSASRGRILDADFAAETAKLAKAQVLQQAGISVLAQANARPQQVLSLLQ